MTDSKPAVARGNIPLVEARMRIERALFADAPNAAAHSDSHKLGYALAQVGYDGDSREEAVLKLMREPEFHDTVEGHSLRALQLLMRETNRTKGSYTRRGVNRGFSHGLTVDPESVDALISVMQRKAREQGVAFRFPEKDPAQSLPLAKTMGTLLDQKGEAFREELTQAMGLSAPPVAVEEVLPAIVEGLREARITSERGNMSRNISPHFFNKVDERCRAEERDAEAEKEKIRLRSAVKSMLFSGNDRGSAISPELAQISRDDVRMFAELVRDHAPRMVEELKRRIQLGEENWKAVPVETARSQELRIGLVKTHEVSGQPVETQIPYTPDNVTRLFSALAEEAAAMKAEGDEISPRVAAAMMRRAASDVESAVRAR